MAIPKSVRVIDSWPFPMAKFKLGTKLYQILDFVREIHDHFYTSGTLMTLVNELRTKLNTGGDVFALLTEIHTKLTTGGDYRVLISAIRSEIIAGGQLSDILLDLEDKAYNQILCAPGWQQNSGGGGNTQIENTAAIDAIIDGVYLAAVYAATQDVAVDGGAATGAGEYRAITLSLSGAGVLTQTVSAIALAAPVMPPRPPSGECPVGVLQIPENFVPGTTAVQTAWFTQGFPRRSTPHTPLATADVSALSASAPGAVSATAMTATSKTKPEQLPDSY